MKKRLIPLLITLCACLLASCALPAEPSEGTNPLPGPGAAPAETEVEAPAETRPSATTEADSKAETEAVSEAGTEADPTQGRTLSFPLTSADDTTSYVILPDLNDEAAGFLEFYVLPTDVEDPQPVLAHRFIIRRDAECNLQVILCRSENSYGFIFMQESTYTLQENGADYRYVQMQCSGLFFVNDKTHVVPATRYFGMHGGDSVMFGYTERQQASILAQHKNPNRVALSHVEQLIDDYDDPDTYDYTILYSYVDGKETVNTPTDSLPAFDFALFREYGFAE